MHCRAIGRAVTTTRHHDPRRPDPARLDCRALGRAVATLGVAALLAFSPALASAAQPNDTPETAVILAGTVSGDVDAVPPTLASGRYAFLRFEYPGDNSPVTISVDITPGDPAAASNDGFRVYGPTNGRLYAEGGQTGTTPSHQVQFSSSEAGTYLVQIFNANVRPIHYEASATGLPPQPTVAAAPVATSAGATATSTPAPVPVGQNTTPESAARLRGTIAASLDGSQSGSFHYYRFEYPGDGSSVRIDLDVTPSDAQTAQTAGFVVYGPTAGREYTRGGYQGRSPTHSTTLVTNEPGTYLVQVFNYGASPIQYEIGASGLPTPAPPAAAAPTPSAASAAAAATASVPSAPSGPVTLGTNTSPDRTIELTGRVSSVLTGGAVAGSHFYRIAYPGGGSAYRLDLDVIPTDRQTGETTGFVIYQPSGAEVGRSAYRGSTRPSHTATLTSTEPGAYLVQVFNASPSAIAYTLSLAPPA